MSASIIGEYIKCKRCGDLFEKRGWNHQYCPACKSIHHIERAMARYYAKRGSRRPRQGNNWSSYKRFSFYMEKTWQSALCPVCGAHMSNDPCSSEQGLRQSEPESVKTWEPWK